MVCETWWTDNSIWCSLNIGSERLICQCIYRTGVSDIYNCINVMRLIEAADKMVLNKNASAFQKENNNVPTFNKALPKPIANPDINTDTVIKKLSKLNVNLLKRTKCTREFQSMALSVVKTVFLDFSKAFDTVAHKRFLIKLKAYCENEVLVNWFKAYLTNRNQRVVLGTYKSEWKEVTSGVPQGSVIGPLLFVIYINNISQEIKNCCKMYSDDTKIILVITNINDNYAREKKTSLELLYEPTNINKIEQVQRRATKIRCLKGMK
ncbi:uncharacterized protein LOC136091986 [Hydra vulgaris]|uniref:Uncharacterized protein LOC136091986 n=1 Tax=Hydra vulgaris TaxID=6087 RepID=A0ABM4DMJ1_HYDVU